MKRIVSVMTIFMLSLLTTGAMAQKSKTQDVDIKVSSQCSMCKETIERTLAFEKGIVNSEVDLETDVVTVTYKPAKTNVDEIKKAISLAGYDADDIKADPKAYSKLSDCCKKPEDRVNKDAHHDHHHH